MFPCQIPLSYKHAEVQNALFFAITSLTDSICSMHAFLQKGIDFHDQLCHRFLVKLIAVEELQRR